uniref:Uncharacterized protein n=1 Tax=Panagrolaimus superbus TaxID=310955 RepID=A0A914XUX3_9BILA
MALSEEQRKERLQDSEKLVFDLFDNMVKYEQQQLEEVKRKCSQYRKEFEGLRHEREAAVNSHQAPYNVHIEGEVHHITIVSSACQEAALHAHVKVTVCEVGHTEAKVTGRAH